MMDREIAQGVAAFLDEMADRLDGWASESERGGWSTHQVTPNRRAADECRRRAANIRTVLRANPAEGSTP